MVSVYYDLAVFLLFMVSITWCEKGILRNLQLKKSLSGEQVTRTRALATSPFSVAFFYFIEESNRDLFD